MSTDKTQLAASILQHVVDGTLSAKDAIEQWPESSTDKRLVIGLHALHHYRDDSDIREYDEAYSQMQRKAIAVLAKVLSNDEPLPDDWDYWNAGNSS